VVNPRFPNNTHSFQLELVGRNKDVLELGCAAGHMTRALAAQGCRVVAVDRDADAVRYAEEFAERVLVLDISDPRSLDELGDGRFDVILAGDVLEHLPDPLSVLRRCKSILRADGALVLSVPNVAHVDLKLALLHGRWWYRDVGLLDRTHLRFYTRRSLLELLLTAGFVPAEMRRVVKPYGTTELAVDALPVPAGVLDVALEDPDAETYQFVLRAMPDSTEPIDARAHSRDELAALATAEACQRRALEAEVEALTLRLRESARDVQTLRQSRTFRYSAWARRISGTIARVHR
jgi:2-polyprenyl-3-methyl-5-hydroxy-6-metoxy-1,4-benzoquinol methylase